MFIGQKVIYNNKEFKITGVNSVVVPLGIRKLKQVTIELDGKKLTVDEFDLKIID